MISVDPLAVGIHIINFLLLIWVLNLILYRPIRRILIQRKEKINGLDEGIKTVMRQAGEKSHSYEMGLKEARGRGLKEKEAFLHAALEEEKRIIEQINLKNQKHMSEMRDRIAEEVKAVKATLLGEVDAFAEIISRKILGRGVS